MCKLDSLLVHQQWKVYKDFSPVKSDEGDKSVLNFFFFCLTVTSVLSDRQSHRRQFETLVSFLLFDLYWL